MAVPNYLAPRDKVRPKNRVKKMDLETRLQQQVVAYLRYQYPKIMVKCDLNGVHLSAMQYKRLQLIGNVKGHPDLVIYEARGGYHGLFLELKQEKTKLFNSKGNPTTEHIGTQNEYMAALRERGYKAEFAVGFAEAKSIIDSYLA